MAQLIYSGLTSLDGYVADSKGNFAFAMPDPEVHAFINDLERDSRHHLYGRRMYEVMSAWETMGGPDEDPVEQDYAQTWRAADKTVYSSSLASVSTSNTTLEREFRPAEIRTLKAETDGRIGIGGATIAGAALAAGLVDELWQMIFPVSVGGGLPFLPQGVALDLTLLAEHRFASGVVYLRYALHR